MTTTSRFLASSKRLVKHFGTLVNYTQEVAGSYDRETSSTSAATITTTSVKAFRAQASSEDSESPNLIGENLFVYLIAGGDLTFNPQADDKIEVTHLTETTKVTVKTVKAYWAGDRVALWRLVCSST